MEGRILSGDEVLSLLPQQEPFRFVDEILRIDENEIEAAYTFNPEADFYRGHFPGNPITPGVILIEAMAQVGVVSLGIYLLGLEVPAEELHETLTVFTDANVDFSGMVKPGSRVITVGKKQFWRRRKLRSAVEMRLEDGTVVCSGTVSGMGVRQ